MPFETKRNKDVEKALLLSDTDAHEDVLTSELHAGKNKILTPSKSPLIP